MGAALAVLLRSKSIRVVTTLDHRSDRTIRLSRDAGVVALDSLAEVVRQSQIILSLVPPAAAEQTAEAYCQLAELSAPSSIYVDCNSISPELAARLSIRLAACGRQFVDATINGLARTAATSGTMFLSGARAQDVAQLFAGTMRVQILGGPAGSAKAMKMLLSGLAKGACALYLEMAMLAQRRGILQEMMAAASQIYPGIAAVALRMMPTIPQHRVRRASEMCELEATAGAAAQRPCLISAIRQFHQELADLPLDTAPASGEWTAESLIEQLTDEQFLAGASPVGDRVLSLT
jgi:3-hydroxyisobutyrate dehydrogenase-like beta-hydroxyacid dehydrogenase